MSVEPNQGFAHWTPAEAADRLLGLDDTLRHRLRRLSSLDLSVTLPKSVTAIWHRLNEDHQRQLNASLIKEVGNFLRQEPESDNEIPGSASFA